MDDSIRDAVLEEFKKFVKYRNQLNRSSKAIVNYLFTHDMKTSDEIIHALKINVPSITQVIHNLLKKDCICEIKDNKQEGPQYHRFSLTEYGRWLAIANKLDLRFMALCVLADAYGVHERFIKNNRDPFYIQTKFTELFPHHIYSEVRLRMYFEELKIKKYAYRHSKKSLKLYPEIFNELKKKYHNDLKNIENWVNSFDDVLCKIIDEKTAEITSKNTHIA